MSYAPVDRPAERTHSGDPLLLSAPGIPLLIALRGRFRVGL